MKLKYLGTAAAEGYPAMFCDCENCRKAFKNKGKNIRSRSQAIIDNSLLNRKSVIFGISFIIIAQLMILTYTISEIAL